MTIVSASTLCAEPRNLKPGVPRGYNVVELDTDAWTGRTHSRHMVNNTFNLPVWGPGLFYATGKSYVDFELCKPLAPAPATLIRPWRWGVPISCSETENGRKPPRYLPR